MAEQVSGISLSRPQVVIVDASNVARFGPNGGKLSRLHKMSETLQKLGLRTVFIADASLRHHIDDMAGYDKLVNEGKLLQSPARANADAFIVKAGEALRAKGRETYIVTNDQELGSQRVFSATSRFMFVPHDDEELLLLDNQFGDSERS